MKFFGMVAMMALVSTVAFAADHGHGTAPTEAGAEAAKTEMKPAAKGKTAKAAKGAKAAATAPTEEVKKEEAPKAGH